MKIYKSIKRASLFITNARFILLVFLLVGSQSKNCLLSITQTHGTEGNLNSVRVMYVGNSGFLINVGKKKILIDALFRGFQGGYMLPQDIQKKIESATPPFDEVDLILATHAHADHFDVDMVRQHLQKNPATIFASTMQAASLLKDFSNRVITFKPIKGKSVYKDINGIQVEAICLSHGTPPPGETEILNYGYLININGVKLFHTGDVDDSQVSFDEFRAYKLPEKKIDIAFIQHYILTADASKRKFVLDGIAGKYIFPIHYHYTEPPIDTELILRNYPDAILFKKELASWVMPIKKKR